MTGAMHPASGRNRRILIVDDDVAVLDALGEYFRRLDYVVIKAGTGRDGLIAFDSQEPDVTILDLRLPDIDGMQVLEVLRRQRALVVLLTGYGDIPTAVQAMQMGAENFLTKPVDLTHLVAAVERAIEKRDLRRENVRLRMLIPTTRKRIVQAAVTAVLVLASLGVGRWVGGLGYRERVLPAIAPTRPPANAPQPSATDSLLHPRGRPALDTARGPGGGSLRDSAPGR